ACPKDPDPPLPHATQAGAAGPGFPQAGRSDPVGSDGLRAATGYCGNTCCHGMILGCDSGGDIRANGRVDHGQHASDEMPAPPLADDCPLPCPAPRSTTASVPERGGASEALAAVPSGAPWDGAGGVAQANGFGCGMQATGIDPLDFGLAG